ncbi:hypothetical protein HCN44_008970 [Aphidius gifuensis]|uniref:Uncharacterized protein n=1 Tax=Aphidius gifuensis TaxID=684658 RepID=A0A834XUQ2_APHGI|nr:uncharacterized protein LOC122855962 [Aphidius gifuensis]KAF7991599.1 hypothetical protein HCN44_008970 [Aphidius gifuensis]
MRYMFRDFMRKRMRPIPKDVALNVKNKLSIVYAFVAWNAATLIVYQLYQYKFPPTEEEKNDSVRYWARTRQTENAHVTRIDGFTVTEKYQMQGLIDIDPTKKPTEQEPQKSPELLTE